MTTFALALREATARLTAAGVDSPALDARLLLEAVTGLSHADIFLRSNDPVKPEDLMVYDHLLVRRSAREPVARIMGVREFWGLPFRLSPATLEPRPDSETLIEATLAHITERADALRILDLGTGTGCLLAALLHELPQSSGLAIDAAEQAVETAQKNLTALGFGGRATVRLGNWAEGIDETFDIVISNPPYISDRIELQPEVARYDPELALYAGADGMEAYARIIPELPRLLNPQGLAVLELGIGQGAAVARLGESHRLKSIEIKPDLQRIERAAVFRKI